MKITKREKFLLRQSLEFLVVRYILSKRRYQGMEKAERHIEIAKVIFDFVHCRKNRGEDWDKVMAIHDQLTVITDNMDQFGFDMNDKEEMDTHSIADLMTEAIIKFVENIKLKSS